MSKKTTLSLTLLLLIPIIMLKISIAADITPPIINLGNPINDSWSITKNNTFYFTPTDQSNITNCTLILNNKKNITIYNIINNSENKIKTNLTEDYWNWTINCTDNNSLEGTNTSHKLLKVDLFGPEIDLISPSHNFIWESDYLINFTYNTSDKMTNISSCRLIINNSVKDSKDTIFEYVEQNLSTTLIDDTYSWKINCTDNNGHESSSSSRTLMMDWNKPPIILSILFDDNNLNPIKNIDLLPGLKRKVYCNISINDTNDHDDIKKVNSTIYYYLNKTSDPDDDNVHYTNSQCEKKEDDGNNNALYSCIFNVTYYANNGTWYCNSTVIDMQNISNDNYNNSKINPLYAINVTSLINFGDVMSGSISQEKIMYVQNFGNMEIDISIEAFGNTKGDNVSMFCDINNISLDDERYSLTQFKLFNDMTPVTSTLSMLENFNLPKQINTSNSQKELYWKIRGTPGSFGDCQGGLTITAYD